MTSTSAVSHQLSVLQDTGCLRRVPGGPRTVEVVLPGRPAARLVGEGTLFMLKVTGDSMIGAAIADGDLVVVRQQPDANNGDIVAATIDGDATVKIFQRSEDGHVWLMPHNPAYAPILGDKAWIMGRIVTVIRRV